MQSFVMCVDLAGTFVFAVSGAMAAVRHRLDLFGILLVALATATFGGIARDVLIGAVPPAAVSDCKYLIIPLVAGLVVFFRYPMPLRWRNHLLIVDAAGLTLCAVSGALKALAFQVTPMAAILLGMITGIGGGIARDLLISEIPLVLRADLYAVAALAGGSIVVIGKVLQLPPAIATAAGAGLCFGLRFMAIRYRWHLPTARAHDRSSSADLDASH